LYFINNPYPQILTGMKRCCLLSLFVCFSFFLLAQPPPEKPIIDTGIFDKWPTVREPVISRNGKYVLYTIYNKPAGGHTLVIQSMKYRWQQEFPNGRTALFTQDSHRVIFMQGNDSLCLFLPATKECEYIPQVSDFRLFKQGKQEWLAYQLSSPGEKLVLRELTGNREQVFEDVTEYQVSLNSAAMVFISRQHTTGRDMETLNWVQLTSTGRLDPLIISTGQSLSRPILAPDGAGVAFITESGENTQIKRTIGYYSPGIQAIDLIDELSPAIDTGFVIEGLSHFSLDGTCLFFTIREKKPLVLDTNHINVDIWSYTDARLQSLQQVQQASYREYMSIINIKDHRFIRLQQADEEWLPITNGKNDGWALVTYRKGDASEESWNRLSQPVYYLQSVKTGMRKVVEVPFAGLSPMGKFLVGNDGQGNFYTYEPATGVTHNITSQLPVPQGDAGYDRPLLEHHRGIGFWGHWLPKDAGMLLYDKYDIWLADPQGMKPPVNLTGGFGRSHNMTFRLMAEEGTTYKMNDRWILDAFDHNNKRNGFYSLLPDKMQPPAILIMEPAVFYAKDYFYLGGERPLRARNKNIFIVRHSSAITAPNYYSTINFRHFTPLSQLYPEKQYNWLQSKLITFTTLNGRTEQAILYQPENFTPQKKYPCIITFYETSSERLNQYRKPAFSAGDINIPYFVSRGYLVLVPDVHYTTGVVAESVYNTITGAAIYAASLPWVNAEKMGITGRSFAGFEVNCLITQCNLFAAACADAGITDLISGWGTYERNTGAGLQDLYERSYYRMGGPPWQKPAAYVKNSPIFHAGQVNTPLLLINNPLDAVVPNAQGIAFFTELRRLGKKVWLLQYKDEGHNLLKKENQIDLTLRIEQFFDHYLKDSLAPVWMLHKEVAH